MTEDVLKRLRLERMLVVDMPPDRVETIDWLLTGYKGLTLAPGEKRVLPITPMQKVTAFRFKRFVIESMSRLCSDVMVTSLRVGNEEQLVGVGIGIPLTELHRNGSLILPTMPRDLRSTVTLHNVGTEPITLELKVEGVGALRP